MQDLPNSVLPLCSLEAEIAVLGAILIDANYAFDKIDPTFDAKYFYSGDNKKIFATMLNLHKNNQAIDVVTVNAALTNNGETGFFGQLIQLARDVPSAANCEFYAAIVKDYAIKRGLKKILVKGSEDLHNNSIADVLPPLMDRLTSASDKALDTGHWQSVKHFAVLALAEIDKEYEGTTTVVKTGIADLDECVRGGLRGGQLVIIAARPGMGKTALALTISINAAKENKVVAFFSLEMSGKELAERVLYNCAEVPSNATTRRGKNGEFIGLRDEEWARLTLGIGQIADMPLNIDDAAQLTPPMLHQRCRELKREKGRLDLIVVDYIGLMQVDGYTNNRVGEITEITRSLKVLAKLLDVPVIALSQLNRSVDARIGKRPMPSDLRDSGSVEQDADIIIFPFREYAYNKEADETKAELIIGKHRSGPIGTCYVKFFGEYTKFVDDVGEKTYGGFDEDQ